MKTEIVNLRRADPPFGSLDRDVYVGRAGGGQDGYFGNPVVAGQVCPECGERHAVPGATLACYEALLDRRLASDPQFRSRVRDLFRRRLGCFCAPGPCHAHLLASRAAALSGAETRRRRERTDASALNAIVAKRELTRSSLPSGHVYVLPGHEDDPYTVHRVTRRSIVLVCGSGGYLVFEGDHRPVVGWWYPKAPLRRTPSQVDEALEAAGYLRTHPPSKQ